MSIINIKKQQHEKAWEKLRDEIFISQDNQDYRALFPDPEYVQVVRKVAEEISGKDFESEEFKELLKNAADKISEQFISQDVSTKLEDVYDLTAYSLIYGSRTVSEVQVALLEYFMDSSRAYFEDTIRILDLGSGTGGALFGAIAFFKKYSQCYGYFANNVKNIIIEFVEQDLTHYEFCCKMVNCLQEENSSFPKISFVSHRMPMEDFLDQESKSDYDFIIASKSISELRCIQPPNPQWEVYEVILKKILELMSQDSVFILIEPPRWRDPIRNKLIPFTVDLVKRTSNYIFSPCPQKSDCFKSKICWAWRFFNYLEPDDSRLIRTKGRDESKFYLLLITKNSYSLFTEIIAKADMTRHGKLEFVGLFHHRQLNYNACIKEELGSYYFDPCLRAKYLFKNTRDELWVFGLDIEGYWQKIEKKQEPMQEVVLIPI